MFWESTAELRMESYTDQAYRLIRTAIVEGRLRPGELLKTTRLAEQLGISRTPIREALQALERERWVERLPTGVMRVTGLRVEEVEELYATREVLEGLLVRFAAMRRTEEHLERLRAVEDEFVAAIESNNLHELESLGFQFHAILHDASGFQLAPEQLASMRDNIYRYRKLNIATPDRTWDAHREHLEILEYVRSQQAEQAEQAMRRHIYNGWLATKKRLEDGDVSLPDVKSPD